MQSRPPWLASVIRVIAPGCALAALSLAAWGYRYAQSRQQAIAYLESNNQVIRFAPRPAWCPAWLPVPQWLQRVEGVWVTNSRLADLDRIPALAELTDLRFLDGENLTDNHLRVLRRFRQLKSLMAIHVYHLGGPGPSFVIPKTSVSDEGLRALADLPLTNLVVTGPGITDGGLGHLRGLPLRHLTLDGAAITDEGLKLIAGLPLNELSLNDTHITDRGLANLPGLPLQELSLRNTNIGDAGMAHLAGLPLERLDLTGTFVTPHGTLAFRGTTTLKELHLPSGTKDKPRAEPAE